MANTIEEIISTSPFNQQEKMAKVAIDFSSPNTWVLLCRLKEAGEYTIRMWIRCDGTDGYGAVGLYADNTRIEQKGPTDTWMEWVKTFATTDTNTYLGLNFYVDGDYYIYHPQIETGNKATDWKRAPEDTEEEIEQRPTNEELATGVTVIDGACIRTGVIKPLENDNYELNMLTGFVKMKSGDIAGWNIGADSIYKEFNIPARAKQLNIIATTAIRSYLLGYTTLDECKQIWAQNGFGDPDINGDGRVDLVDVYLARSIILGYIDDLSGVGRTAMKSNDVGPTSFATYMNDIPMFSAGAYGAYAKTLITERIANVGNETEDLLTVEKGLKVHGTNGETSLTNTELNTRDVSCNSLTVGGLPIVGNVSAVKSTGSGTTVTFTCKGDIVPGWIIIVGDGNDACIFNVATIHTTSVRNYNLGDRTATASLNGKVLTITTSSWSNVSVISNLGFV